MISMITKITSATAPRIKPVIHIQFGAPRFSASPFPRMPQTTAAIANGGGGCPMLQATGVPCPACGATRAFVLFSHGDMGGAMRFNWSWLVIWFVIVGAMFTAAWRLWQQRAALPDWLHRFGGWLQTHPAAVVALPFALLLGPWLVALANLNAIR